MSEVVPPTAFECECGMITSTLKQMEEHWCIEAHDDDNTHYDFEKQVDQFKPTLLCPVCNAPLRNNLHRSAHILLFHEGET